MDKNRVVLVVVLSKHVFWDEVQTRAKKAKSAELHMSDGRAVIDGIEYRHVPNPKHMMSFRGVETEFWRGAEHLPDYAEFKRQAYFAKHGPGLFGSRA